MFHTNAVLEVIDELSRPEQVSGKHTNCLIQNTGERKFIAESCINQCAFDLKLDAVKVVRDPCQKITLLLLKSKSVRVIVPESCF